MPVAPKYQRIRIKCARCGQIVAVWKRSQRYCSLTCAAAARSYTATDSERARETGMRGGDAYSKSRQQAQWESIRAAWPEMPERAVKAIEVFMNLRYRAGYRRGDRFGFARGFDHAIAEQGKSLLAMRGEAA